MRPTEALTRAAYYLDRELAPSSKVRAFLRAAEIAESIGDDELAQRADAGTLTELDGIGPSTAQVISEALQGVDDGYLAKLDVRTRLPLGEGAELRAALRGDCHLHSTWSDGGASVRAMAQTAIDLGHEYMVLTDHSPRLTIAHGLNEARLRAQIEEVRALNDELAPFRILTGLEVDILEDGSLDLSDEMLEELDVVVASVHSKFRMPREDMTRRMVLAVASPHVDILGHCTNRKVSGGGRAPVQFDAEIVFAACSRFGTAVEINCRPERQDPPEELLALALDWDCDIAISTDAHAPGQLEWQVYGCDKATRCGVPTESVVNTWAADDLLAWAASHPAG
ncbi:MAG TPA: PHP domain-containing protein [Acidimicrobiales bacterium]|jgi:putative hydrolase|nr:PHP domain-containing protein [Acidimicrobiales bacterium]